MSVEEKTQFDEWNRVLSKEQLTLEEVKEYCQSQTALIEAKWSDYDIPQEKKNELMPYYTVYKSIHKVIGAPKMAREALEKHLNQLIK